MSGADRSWLTVPRTITSDLSALSSRWLTRHESRTARPANMHSVCRNLALRLQRASTSRPTAGCRRRTTDNALHNSRSDLRPATHRDSLVEHLDSNSLIAASQHGFRRGGSCLLVTSCSFLIGLLTVTEYRQPRLCRCDLFGFRQGLR